MATKTSISVFAQLVKYLPRRIVEDVAAKYPQKARGFSYSEQLYLLMLGHMLHAFSLNEIVDISTVHEAELWRSCHVSSAALNTFSHANRTRDPKVAEEVYWSLAGMLGSDQPALYGGRNPGRLFKFRNHRILAIDSSVIQLSLNCVDWARYIHGKAAVKLHMRTDIANMMPNMVIIGDRASEYDTVKAPALCADMKRGDILVADRGYQNYRFFDELDKRGVNFVIRERCSFKFKALESRTDLPKDVESDETVGFKVHLTRKKYTGVLRRVSAIVEVDGVKRRMVFLTNNTTWSARTIADIYKGRWQIELLFKELKQTLQLHSFYGTNSNAVRWQIWAALIVHLLMRYLKCLTRWNSSYSRLIGIVRAAVWMHYDILDFLRFYGIAPPQGSREKLANAPYLPGFEKYFIRAMGQQKAQN